MEQTLTHLDQLIEKLNSLLPDDNDLKGFQGITKVLIITTLQETRATLFALKEFDSRFETIILKRELADLFNNIDHGTNEKFDRIKNSDFNSILKEVAKIKFRVIQTYYSVRNSPPIRTQ